MTSLSDSSLSKFKGQSWLVWHSQTVGKGNTDSDDAEKEVVASSSGAVGSVKLPRKDCKTFGICPTLDECILVVCDACSAILKPQALAEHVAKRHKEGSSGITYSLDRLAINIASSKGKGSFRYRGPNVATAALASQSQGSTSSRGSGVKRNSSAAKLKRASKLATSASVPSSLSALDRDHISRPGSAASAALTDAGVSDDVSVISRKAGRPRRVRPRDAVVTKHNNVNAAAVPCKSLHDQQSILPVSQLTVPIDSAAVSGKIGPIGISGFKQTAGFSVTGISRRGVVPTPPLHVSSDSSADSSAGRRELEERLQTGLPFSSAARTTSLSAASKRNSSTKDSSLSGARMPLVSGSSIGQHSRSKIESSIDIDRHIAARRDRGKTASVERVSSKQQTPAVDVLSLGIPASYVRGAAHSPAPSVDSLRDMKVRRGSGISADSMDMAAPSPAASVSSVAAPATPGSTGGERNRKGGKSSRCIPCKDREYDTDRHCGVWIDHERKRCTRSLTCKTHALSLRRKVEGRTKPFDALLQESRNTRELLKEAKLKAMVTGVKVGAGVRPASASSSSAPPTPGGAPAVGFSLSGGVQRSGKSTAPVPSSLGGRAVSDGSGMLKDAVKAPRHPLPKPRVPQAVIDRSVSLSNGDASPRGVDPRRRESREEGVSTHPEIVQSSRHPRPAAVNSFTAQKMGHSFMANRKLASMRQAVSFTMNGDSSDIIQPPSAKRARVSGARDTPAISSMLSSPARHPNSSQYRQPDIQQHRSTTAVKGERSALSPVERHPPRPSSTKSHVGSGNTSAVAAKRPASTAAASGRFVGSGGALAAKRVRSKPTLQIDVEGGRPKELVGSGPPPRLVLSPPGSTSNLTGPSQSDPHHTQTMLRKLSFMASNLSPSSANLNVHAQQTVNTGLNAATGIHAVNNAVEIQARGGGQRPRTGLISPRDLQMTSSMGSIVVASSGVGPVPVVMATSPPHGAGMMMSSSAAMAAAAAAAGSSASGNKLRRGPVHPGASTVTQEYKKGLVNGSAALGSYQIITNGVIGDMTNQTLHSGQHPADTMDLALNPSLRAPSVLLQSGSVPVSNHHHRPVALTVAPDRIPIYPSQAMALSPSVASVVEVGGGPGRGILHPSLTPSPQPSLHGSVGGHSPHVAYGGGGQLGHTLTVGQAGGSVAVGGHTAASSLLNHDGGSTHLVQTVPGAAVPTGFRGATLVQTGAGQLSMGPLRTRLPLHAAGNRTLMSGRPTNIHPHPQQVFHPVASTDSSGNLIITQMAASQDQNTHHHPNMRHQRLLQVQHHAQDQRFTAIHRLPNSVSASIVGHTASGTPVYTVQTTSGTALVGQAGRSLAGANAGVVAGGVEGSGVNTNMAATLASLAGGPSPLAQQQAMRKQAAASSNGGV